VKVHIIISLALFWCLPARASTITAASCSQTDVQNAVNSAVSGDTVVVPGGTCSWGGGTVTVPSTKGITVNGGGTATITGSSHISLTSNVSTSTRITGFTFTGAWPCCGNFAIKADGSPSTAPYRIDHNTITGDVATNGQTLMEVDNNGPGLIDHNTLTAPNNAEIIHNVGLGANGNLAWTDNVTPGGPTMVFIEDNTFTNSASGTICSGIQSYYGARTVVRHNIFNFCQVDQHGTAGSIGARWWEIYSNNFNTPNGQNQCCIMDIRAGSGVIYNNTVSGTNTGAGSIDLREEDAGTWPLAYQIGSGINGQTNGHNSCTGGALNSSPAYVWGALEISRIASQSPTVTLLNRDYFVSTGQPLTLFRQELVTDTCPTTYNYVPYTYPHPLQNPSSIAAPTGLALVIH